MQSFVERFRLGAIQDRLSSSLTLIPGTAMLLALAGAWLTVWIDERVALRIWYTYRGQPQSARELLSTLASSLLAVTGVVFSITILVLQLANSQFSSRVLKTFLKDRQTQLSMGVLMGSFVYSVALLPSVRDQTSSRAAFVPELSITVAFGLALLSMAFFIRYIHHMAHSIRAVEVVRRIAVETQESLQRMYPELAEAETFTDVHTPEREPELVLHHAGAAGVIVSVDEHQLLHLSSKHDLFIQLVRYVGDFVPREAPLLRVWGTCPNLEHVAACILIDQERTLYQDPGFGLRQLVDVAERALSPGINDPTTAVQALDQVHDLLRWLSQRAFPSPLVSDAAGAPRLRLPRPDFDAYVHLGLDEIRQFGASSIQISRRLRELLDDLLGVAVEPRRAVLRHQLELLDATVIDQHPAPDERALARQPSSQGHGPAGPPH